MKWFSSLAVAAFISGTVAVQAGPDEDYINLYQWIEEGDQFAASGQVSSAREKYSAAQESLKKLKAAYPNWNEKTVEFRLNYVTEKLNKLGAAAAPATTPAVAKPAPTVAPADPVAELRAQVAQLTEDRKVLQAKLAEALTAQPAAIDPRELQKVQAQNTALQKEKDLLRVALEQEQAKTANAADKSGLEKAQKEIESLRSQLAAGAAPMTAMERELANAREAAAASSLKASALQKALDEMRGERDAVLARAAAASAAADAKPQPVAAPKSAEDSTQIKDLKRERDELEKRLQLANRDIADLKTKRAKSGSPTADAERTERQLAILRGRLEVLEARQVPYTPEELALLKQPGTTVKPPPTKAESKRKELPAGAGILLSDAQRAFLAKDFPKAEEKYLEVLKMDEKNLITLGNLGSVQLQMGHLADAEATLTKAESLDATDPFVLTTLGALRIRQNKNDEAFDLLSRAAELDPRNPETQSYLGVVLSQKGQRVAAETALRKAVELAPNYAPAHHNLAVVYATQQPPFLELAKYHYNKAVSLGYPSDEKVEKLLKGEKP